MQLRPSVRRTVSGASKQKQEGLKDDNKSGKSVGRGSGSASQDRDLTAHQSAGPNTSTAAINGNTLPTTTKIVSASARIDTPADGVKLESVAKPMESRVSTSKDDDDLEVPEIQKSLTSRPYVPPPDDSFNIPKSTDKQIKRSGLTEEQDRLNKRRRGESDVKDGEGDARFLDRERSTDLRHQFEVEKVLNEERAAERVLDRSKVKGSERYDRDYRERLERPDKSSGEDIPGEKFRDRSIERHGRERSVEKVQERGLDRSFDRVIDRAKDDRIKDDRIKPRYSESSLEKSHVDEHFHRQSLPPPPPLPPNLVPQSVNSSRRDDDADRRGNSTRHGQRLSPRHEDKERRRSVENTSVSQDDGKRRREDEFTERKREERDSLFVKVSNGPSPLSLLFHICSIFVVVALKRFIWC